MQTVGKPAAPMNLSHSFNYEFQFSVGEFVCNRKSIFLDRFTSDIDNNNNRTFSFTHFHSFTQLFRIPYIIIIHKIVETSKLFDKYKLYRPKTQAYFLPWHRTMKFSINFLLLLKIENQNSNRIHC